MLGWHAKSLHERVVVLSVITEDVPHVSAAERLTVEWLAHGFARVVGRYNLGARSLMQ